MTAAMTEETTSFLTLSARNKVVPCSLLDTKEAVRIILHHERLRPLPSDPPLTRSPTPASPVETFLRACRLQT